MNDENSYHAINSFLAILALFLPALVSASSEEAIRTVIEIIDADAIDVQVASLDGRTTENPSRIRLPDIDAPEGNAPGSLDARQYASQITSVHALALDQDDWKGSDQRPV